MTQQVFTDAETAVTIRYRNHRGEVADRRILPRGLSFGGCEWHPGPQWLLLARDLDKDADRTFAVKDILAWTPGFGGKAATGHEDWFPLPAEPCRFCRRPGGVWFLADEGPEGRDGLQSMRCDRCGRAWVADSATA